MPALPLDDAGPYVAAAYLVFVGLILVYVAIMAAKLVRIERDVSELLDLVEQREGGARDEHDSEVTPRETGPRDGSAHEGTSARRAPEAGSPGAVETR